MKIGYSVTQYLVHRINSVVTTIDVYHMVGSVMVIVIAQLGKMNLLMFVDQEIGLVLHRCLNVILVDVLIKISYAMAVSRN